MPDFNIMVAYTCDSVTSFSKEVIGSRGDRYTVRVGPMYDGPYQYGWSCTCMGWRSHKKDCKHIRKVRGSVEYCGWNAEMEPTSRPLRDPKGNTVCPGCGGPVTAWRVAV